MFKFKSTLVLFVAIAAIFFGRILSVPLVSGEYNNGTMDNEIAVYAGNFNQRVDEVQEDKSSILIHGVAPLIMYMLSLLCLIDLIKSTFTKFISENDMVYKTLYILLMILQLSLMAVISFYVADMTIKVLVIWLLIALVLVRVIYEGNYFMEVLKKSKR